MKKGITPIIAIIILLLITIGLAATAWTYLSGFLAGYTKSLQLVDSYCMGATTTTVVLRNTGPDPIALGASCSISGSVMTCGSMTVTRTDANLDASAAISTSGNLAAGSTFTFTDVCTPAGTPAVCTYRFVAGGTGATVVSVPCG